jgi:hypothetical protein
MVVQPANAIAAEQANTKLLICLFINLCFVVVRMRPNCVARQIFAGCPIS